MRVHNIVLGVRGFDDANAVVIDGGGFELGQSEVDPLRGPGEISFGVEFVGIVPVIFPQAIRRIGDDQENIEAAIAAYEASAEIITREGALEAFYGRLGFERSGGAFEGSPVMVRAPR